MAKRIRRSKSNKKSAVDKQIEQLKKASGGKVSDQLDALIDSIREEEEKEDDFLNVDNLLKELEKSRKKDEQEKKKRQRESKKAVDNAIKKIKNGNKRETQTENIDPRILKLLGLEDYEAELDYEDYKRLLKEKMAADRMGGGKGEEQEGDNELLKNEFRRAQKQSGSFKVQANRNKRKTKTSNFVSKRSSRKPKPKSVRTTKLLPSAGQTSSPENVKAEIQEDTQEQLLPLSKTLDDINNNLDKLLKIERQKLELEKQAAREAAKKEETEGFRKKEAELEDTEKKSAKKVSKTLKPASNIFDSILNFFKNVLLGGAISLILDIIQNPGKYLKPLIDFGNFIIDFINDKIIKFINDIVFAPINAYIGLWNKAFNEIEWALKQLAKVLPNIPTPKLPRIPTVALPYIKPIQYPQWMQQQEGGGEVIDIKNLSLFDGGAIDKLTGLQIKGMGKDTQLIAAQPGEIMMSKKAVNMFGAGNLLAANAMAGGNNKPKFGKIQGFQGGGQVGKLVIGAGHSPSEDNAMRGIALGSDGRPVEGTEDFKTGVPEWKAARHLVKSIKSLVSNNPALSSRISFENITAYTGDKGLSGVPYRVEQQSGTQFVDLHFDARGGRGGVLRPESDRVSSVDRAMASVFGNYPGIKPSEKGVTAAGGTILEVAAIDDPSIGMFLGEVKNGMIGNESLALATKVLNSMLPGLSDSPSMLPGGQGYNGITPTQAQTGQVSGSTSSPGNATISRPTTVLRVPGPPSMHGGGGGSGGVLPIPVGGQGSNSAASAAQKQIPGFSAEDSSNFDLIVVKSIYNIVG